jgi:hypothetical protein
MFVFVSYNSRCLVLFVLFFKQGKICSKFVRFGMVKGWAFSSNYFFLSSTCLGHMKQQDGRDSMLEIFCLKTYQMVVFQANFNSSSVLGVSIETLHVLAFPTEFWNVYNKAFFNFEALSLSTCRCHSTLASFHYASTLLQYFIYTHSHDCYNVSCVALCNIVALAIAKWLQLNFGYVRLG